MAEKIILKARIKSIHFSDPITSAADLATAVWAQQPLTLRDDQLVITEEDPEENQILSHENDIPEDIDVTGKGLSASGSFINATRDQLTDILGGDLVGEGDAALFHKSASKLLLNKAIKFTLKDDSTLIAVNAKGYCSLNSDLGVGGKQKYPFRFRFLPGSGSWNVDLVM